jgi:hypothetical protein
MKISKLIEQAQQILKDEGDLEVDLWQDDAEESGDFGGFATLMDHDDKPVRVTLCGP